MRSQSSGGHFGFNTRLCELPGFDLDEPLLQGLVAQPEKNIPRLRHGTRKQRVKYVKGEEPHSHCAFVATPSRFSDRGTTRPCVGPSSAIICRRLQRRKKRKAHQCRPP